MCTAFQKSVAMYQGGPWISALSLWIKVVVIHSGDYPQFSGPLINWAKGQLFTGLNPQKDCAVVRKKTQKSGRGQKYSVQPGKMEGRVAYLMARCMGTAQEQ
jgi:hypothetical protein